MNYSLMFDIYKDACFAVGVPVFTLMILYAIFMCFKLFIRMIVHPIFFAHAFIKYGHVNESLMEKRFWKIRAYLIRLSRLKTNLCGYGELTTRSNTKCNISIDFNRIIPKYIFRPDSKTGLRRSHE